MPIIEIWSRSENEHLNYIFWGSGEPSFHDDPDDIQLGSEENNDSIHIDPNDGYVVAGHTGNEYGDSYDIPAQPDGFLVYDGNSDYDVIYDGSNVTDSVTTSDLPSFIDQELMEEWVLYHNDDLIERIEGDDGGDGGDGGGEEPTTTVIEDFESQDMSPYNAINGNYHNWVFTDAADEPIGGGYGYQNTVAESEATVTVSTFSELRSEVESASSGDIVYITNDIDATGISNEADAPVVPSGVTLAGDRGIDGSLGPKYTSDILDDWPPHALVAEGGARITGFRVEGPHLEWSPADVLSNESDPYPEWTQQGINVQGSGAEIDNMEVYGYGGRCINSNDANVHHCNVHRGTTDGQGYGIDTGYGTTMRYNLLSHCRHTINNSGGGAWTAEHNINTGPVGGHQFDMHDPGGDYVEMFNNTITGYSVTDDDASPGVKATHSNYVPAFAQRDVPNDQATSNDNWFYNPLEPPASPEGWSEHSIIQALVSSYQNISWSGNSYGYDSDPGTAGSQDGRQLRSDGSYALACYSGAQPTSLLSDEGLDRYPEEGETFRFFFRVDNTMNRFFSQFLFGVQDETSEQNRYELEMDNDEIRLQVDESGSDTNLGSTTVDWDTQVPYRIEVDWQATGTTVTVYEHHSNTEVASFEAAQDSTYTSGGIGFYSNSLPSVLFDDVEIVS